MKYSTILWALVSSLTILTSEAQALIQIPYQMSTADMNKALQIFGYGSATKVLDDPYPLGGYDGLEIGFSNETMHTDRISSLGAGATQQSQTSYQSVTLGKGIYNNIDTFVSFSLLGQAENISEVGGQIRWGFFQASYLPIYLSWILHGNTFNCQNLIVTNSLGMDLIAGFKEGDVTLYFGGGPIRASGNFTGGIGGITSSGQTQGIGILDSRFLAGLNIKFGKYFVVGEIDNYASAAYAAKIGYRY